MRPTPSLFDPSAGCAWKIFSIYWFLLGREYLCWFIFWWFRESLNKNVLFFPYLLQNVNVLFRIARPSMAKTYILVFIRLCLTFDNQRFYVNFPWFYQKIFSRIAIKEFITICCLITTPCWITPPLFKDFSSNLTDEKRLRYFWISRGENLKIAWKKFC